MYFIRRSANDDHTNPGLVVTLPLTSPSLSGVRCCARRGRVQLIQKNDADFYMEECHDFFDVLGLFSERQHTISVRSLTHTDLYKVLHCTRIAPPPRDGLSPFDAASGAPYGCAVSRYGS